MVEQQPKIRQTDEISNIIDIYVTLTNKLKEQ